MQTLPSPKWYIKRKNIAKQYIANKTQREESQRKWEIIPIDSDYDPWQWHLTVPVSIISLPFSYHGVSSTQISCAPQPPQFHRQRSLLDHERIMTTFSPRCPEQTQFIGEFGVFVSSARPGLLTLVLMSCFALPTHYTTKSGSWASFCRFVRAYLGMISLILLVFKGTCNFLFKLYSFSLWKHADCLFKTMEIYISYCDG